MAALDLAKKKFHHGPDWGVTEAGPPNKGRNLTLVLDGLKRRASLVGDSETVNRLLDLRSSASGVPAKNDAEAAACAAGEATKAGVHFVWTQFRGYHAWQEERAQERRAAVDAYARAANAGAPPPDLPPLHDGVHPSPPLSEPELPEDALERLKQVDAHVGRVHAALPPNSLLVVATCLGDTPEVRRLRTMAWRRGSRLDGLPSWSETCEAHLDRLRMRASRALCFATVKQ